MCNSMPLSHLTENVTPLTDNLMICLMSLNIHKELEFVTESALLLPVFNDFIYNRLADPVNE